MANHRDFISLWFGLSVPHDLASLSIFTDRGFNGSRYVRLEHYFSLYHHLPFNKTRWEKAGYLFKVRDLRVYTSYNINFWKYARSIIIFLYSSNTPEQERHQAETFIRALANASYGSFENVPDYPAIPSSKYMELLLNLTNRFSPTLTIGASGISMNIQKTITEFGVCYAVNSNVAVYNSPE